MSRHSAESDATEVREVWAIRWPGGTVTAGQYSPEGDDYAEQMVRFLARDTDGEVVHRTVTITRTPWEAAPEPTCPTPPAETDGAS